MKATTKRILIIADVISQIKDRRFQARCGRYIGPETDDALRTVGTYTTDDNGPAVQKAVCELEHCEACAKGALFLAYIERYNTVPSAVIARAHDFGVIEKTGLGELFGPDLLAEIEAAFEGAWYVGEPSEVDRALVRGWRRGALVGIKGYSGNDDLRDQPEVANALLLKILQQLLDNDGEKLILPRSNQS
jgi:hypothetical protein